MRDPATKAEWLASLRQHTYPSVTVLPEWFWTGAAIIALLCILVGLPGCAEDRWLTKEEDAEMRAHCEPHGGCALVPFPVWEQIKRALGITDA